MDPEHEREDHGKTLLWNTLGVGWSPKCFNLPLWDLHLLVDQEVPDTPWGPSCQYPSIMWQLRTALASALYGKNTICHTWRTIEMMKSEALCFVWGPSYSSCSLVFHWIDGPIWHLFEKPHLSIMRCAPTQTLLGACSLPQNSQHTSFANWCLRVSRQKYCPFLGPFLNFFFAKPPCPQG